MRIPTSRTSYHTGRGQLQLLFVTAALIGASGAACQPQPHTPVSGTPPTVARQVTFIGPSADDPRTPAIFAGAQRFIRSLPAYQLATASPTDHSAAALQASIRSATKTHIDALVVFVEDASAVTDVLDEVQTQYTLCVAVGAPIDSQAIQTQVRVDWEAGARLLGAHLTELSGPARSFVVLRRDDPAASAANYNAFRHAANREYGLAMLGETRLTGVAEADRRAVRDLLETYPRTRLVVSLSQFPWTHTPPSQILKDAQRFAAVGAPPEFWRHLVDGRAAGLIGYLDGDAGFLAMQAVFEQLTSSGDPHRIRGVAPRVVKREDLPVFIADYAEAAGVDVAELLARANVTAETLAEIARNIATSTRPNKIGDGPE